MAWILTLDVVNADSDEITEQLWALGTNGVAEVNGEAVGEVRLLAGFETEPAALAAASVIGGSVAPVDPAAWSTPATATVTVGGAELTIDAGHSFGHGAHPTTQLCLDALERHVEPGSRVLDVGCGSGVLALSARVLGAERVTAIDIDPAALAATEANAATNDIDVDASLTPIEQVEGSFEVVVVNMLVAELENIAPDVRRVASRLLILSGALIEQADRWSAMFPGCKVIETTSSGEWAGQVMQIDE